MKLYFFGCTDRLNKGHYLHRLENGHLHKCWSGEEREIPFQYSICDGGLLPKPEVHGQLYIAHINGFTIISCWDRTGDSRPASCASFIADQHLEFDDMERICKQQFPELWQRIQPHQKNPNSAPTGIGELSLDTATVGSSAPSTPGTNT